MLIKMISNLVNYLREEFVTLRSPFSALGISKRNSWRRGRLSFAIFLSTYGYAEDFSPIASSAQKDKSQNLLFHIMIYLPPLVVLISPPRFQALFHIAKTFCNAQQASQ